MSGDYIEKNTYQNIYLLNSLFYNMSDFLDSIKSVIEGTIDFESQKFTEDLSYKGLIIGSVISAILGFISQDIRILLFFFVLTVLVILALVVPPYPSYNKNKITNWQASSFVDITELK